MVVEEKKKESGLAAATAMIDDRGGPDTAPLQALMKVVMLEEGYGYFSEQEGVEEVEKVLLDPVEASEQEKMQSVWRKWSIINNIIHTTSSPFYHLIPATGPYTGAASSNAYFYFHN